MKEQPRWHVVLRYRTSLGPLVEHHDVEELDALRDIVGRGPDWNCLIDCVVTLNRVITPGLTIEQAATQ